MKQIQTKATAVQAAQLPGELRADWGVHPGAFLKRYMDEHGIRQAELAERTGLTSKHVNQIVKQVVGITPDVAVLLETALGTPHRFWSQVGADWDMHLSGDLCRDCQDVLALTECEATTHPTQKGATA